MRALRHWSVRHAGRLERLYAAVERALVRLDPLWRRLGDGRAGRLLAGVERPVKAALFDCRMCGRCILGATGMSCPMNCPKELRNGPCGGVRPNGHCEVVPEMRCVWVEAFEGSRRMAGGDAIRDLQPPVDHRRFGRSSWLEAVREKRAGGEAP